jgi:hypothetical protein
MSYTEYLRRKAAVAPVVLNTLKPTDASMLTMKKRMGSSSVFFADGTSVGTLLQSRDLSGPNNAAITSRKAIGVVPESSSFIEYRGGQAIGNDAAYRRGEIVQTKCCGVQTSYWSYLSGSDYMRTIKCADTASGVIDAPGDSKFVDNTIRLSAGVPEMVASGCCNNSGITTPNHIHSPGIQNAGNTQPYAVGKRFFMANPPQPQGYNMSPRKVGTYTSPIKPSINLSHGYVQPTRPIPTAPGGKGQRLQA